MATDGGRLVGAGARSALECRVACWVPCRVSQVRIEGCAEFVFDCQPLCVCACATLPKNNTFPTERCMFESVSGQFPSCQTVQRRYMTLHGLETPGVSIEPRHRRGLSAGVAREFPSIPGVTGLSGGVGNGRVWALVSREDVTGSKAMGMVN